MVLLDLRWEIKPSWRVHPYFTLGAGAVFTKVIDDYLATSWYVDTRNGETFWDKWTTGGNFEDFDYPVLPVLELIFGLKAELLKKKLSLGVEGGLLDGLVYRGTLSFRF